MQNISLLKSGDHIVDLYKIENKIRATEAYSIYEVFKN